MKRYTACNEKWAFICCRHHTLIALAVCYGSNGSCMQPSSSYYSSSCYLIICREYALLQFGAKSYNGELRYIAAVEWIPRDTPCYFRCDDERRETPDPHRTTENSTRWCGVWGPKKGRQNYKGEDEIHPSLKESRMHRYPRRFELSFCLPDVILSFLSC